MDGANTLAENWLRAAAGAIAQREVAAGKPMPVAELKAFASTTSHSPAARELAFELLRQARADEADALVPTFLNDPAAELRREPVARLIAEAKGKAEARDTTAATATYQRALEAARDEDQIRTIADALKELGQKPDLPKHFGFLMDWQVIGPFDNTGREGFATVFPPEKGVDLTASHPGKEGKPLNWQPFSTRDEYGKVDLNKPLGMVKAVTGYATTTFHSEKEREAELRLGCKNAWKVWLNGELLFARDEYHRGARLAQYKMPCRLKAGPNVILVKCCQNEQTETWTVEWEFQLRVCDSTGTAITSAKP